MVKLCIYLYIYMHVHMCICAYVLICICIYVCIYHLSMYLSLAKLVGKAHQTLSQFILFSDGLYSMNALFTEYNLVKRYPIYKQMPMKI